MCVYCVCVLHNVCGILERMYVFTDVSLHNARYYSQLQIAVETVIQAIS